MDDGGIRESVWKYFEDRKCSKYPHIECKTCKYFEFIKKYIKLKQPFPCRECILHTTPIYYEIKENKNA